MEAEVDNEIVALSIDTGFCYGLNPVGARVWRMLGDPIRVADICSKLTSEYQVDPETCQSEVIALLEDLRAEGMIGEPGSVSAAKGQA